MLQIIFSRQEWQGGLTSSFFLKFLEDIVYLGEVQALLSNSVSIQPERVRVFTSVSLG